MNRHLVFGVIFSPAELLAGLFCKTFSGIIIAGLENKSIFVTRNVAVGLTPDVKKSNQCFYIALMRARAKGVLRLPPLQAVNLTRTLIGAFLLAKMNIHYESYKALIVKICQPVEPEKLTVYFGCSRWTNPNRNHAGHIAPEYGHPLCGKTYQNGASCRFALTAETASQVTCERCKKLAAFDLKFGKQ